jgi:hypothetical protein
MAVQAFTMSAPYGGLDLVSPIDNMDPAFALDLSNIFPAPSAPEIRRGYRLNASVAGSSAIRALRALPLANGTTKLVAFSGSTIYSVAGGTATAVSGTALTTANASTEVFKNRLFSCNGLQAVQVYDGTTRTDSTFTGVTLADLINVSVYKKRIYFIKKNSFEIWYGPADAITGTLTLEDVSGQFTRGGFLVFAGSYTNQTAQTSADLFFAISSEGEIIFYSGTNPSDWALVARYVIGKPLGYNAFVRVNNDAWVITQQGIVPISALFASDAAQALNTISAKINETITASARLTPFSYRWEGIFSAINRRVYIIIPVTEDLCRMLVWSIDTRGWTVYNLHDRKDCISICEAGNTVYYGSADGKVYEAEYGYNDRGNPIQFTLTTAFSFYGARGNFKAFKDIRPLLLTSPGQRFQVVLNTDFRRQFNTGTITTGAGTFTPWGSPWGSPWAGGVDYVYDRYAVKGQGHSAAIQFTGSVQDFYLQIFGFEVRFDLGGQV